MNQKNYLTLDNEFLEYCKLNDILEVNKYAEEVFRIGFNVIKYGNKPKLIEKENEVNIPKQTPIKNTNKPNSIYEE